MAVGRQYRSNPRPRLDAEQTEAVTAMSPPEQQRLTRRIRFAIILALPLVLAGGNAMMCLSEDREDPRIAYTLATPNNVVTRLQNRIDSGQVALVHDSKRGYLPAVLKALQIPTSSQMLVFSKTSVQKELISPQTPRALYFNDDVYVGYVPDSKTLEVVTADPQLGPVYYVLLQRQKDKPLFFRTVGACLECHATKVSNYVPEHLMRSVFVEADGEPIPKAQSFVTTDASPLNERWGGWYVTGKHGSQRHMGNTIARKHDDEVTIDLEQGANITHLHGLVPSYLTPHSDIVALMVMAHQTHLQNLITEANYQTKAALRDEKSARTAARHREDDRAVSLASRVEDACEPLVKAMLFVDEVPLKSPISGTSGFAEQFAARVPRDRKNRSLRELDLKRRLFRYPCSYTIFSEGFDALPDPAKDYVFRRLKEVLSGRDHNKAFAHLSAADRKAVREILLETKPSFRAWSVRR
jgi:hypothetical protein